MLGEGGAFCSGARGAWQSIITHSRRDFVDGTSDELYVCQPSFRLVCWLQARRLGHDEGGTLDEAGNEQRLLAMPAVKDREIRAIPSKYLFGQI